MARLFDDASSQYLENGTAVLTAVPLTMACWFNSNDDTITQALMAIGATTGLDRFQLDISGSTAGDPVRASATSASVTNAIASSSTGYSANTWQHACGVFASATSRAAYISGGSKGTDTTSVTPSFSTNATTIGTRYLTAVRGAFMSGIVAEAAIWNVALTDAEVAVLATGISPLAVRPASLRFYAPLWGNYSPEIDVIGRFDLTVNGATKADHCRIIQPRKRKIFVP